LAAGGVNPGLFKARVRRLEVSALRGPRPAPGLAGLRARIGEDGDMALWLEGLERACAPLAALMARNTAALTDLVGAHIHMAEALAADETTPGAERLWRKEDGEATAEFLHELMEAADALPELPGRRYPALLEALMTGRQVRAPWAGHPRLFVWGNIEARFRNTDMVILGGLNEGTWPPSAESDPWMSRPMRANFGLPLPERRIGLSAHDFAQAFCAPEVVLTRAARVDGTPTVPSRWLLRLDTVLRASGLCDAQGHPAWPPAPWVEWFVARDRPDRIEPGRPPAPKPPVRVRPRQLSATQIETWMRDPYAIYARHILKLHALDPIDADPGAADYGSWVHKALDAFLKAYPDALPAQAEQCLVAVGREVFGPALAMPGVWAFWWPRFLRIAEWFVARERERRPLIGRTHSEVSGTLEIASPYAPFTVSAKADRIDRLKDGTLVLIDYKTGQPPSQKEVAAGFAPQLPLEALIARHGGFTGVPAAAIGGMWYWRLKGGEPAGEEKTAGGNPEKLLREALEGLSELVRTFDDADIAYAARPHPDRAPRYSDYLHLARVKEWAALEGDED
ncbi:MAG: double-strand break repair protein AddB, partial [Rhodospirillales bacterium]|nr:double-strand break repair protein AddB [Rhodospirillales bacterium]